MSKFNTNMLYILYFLKDKWKEVWDVQHTNEEK